MKNLESTARLGPQHSTGKESDMENGKMHITKQVENLAFSVRNLQRQNVSSDTRVSRKTGRTGRAEKDVRIKQRHNPRKEGKLTNQTLIGERKECDQLLVNHHTLAISLDHIRNNWESRATNRDLVQ